MIFFSNLFETTGSEDRPQRFELGTVYVSAGVRALMDIHPARHGLGLILLEMHRTGDWGQVPSLAAAQNEDALVHEGRILSAYEVGTGIWIYVETNRQRTETRMFTPPEL